ncbi:MAG TPA: YfhO family protein, partial [Bacilli bacterium]|nr:YfhO family protein [Bacilli bacterium]
ISSSKNILFSTFMGVKYLITNSMVPIGYTNVENSNIYINENVYPIGYSTTNIMSQDDYDELSYPDNIYALMTNVIVDDSVESEFKSKTKEETLSYEITDQSVTIEKEDDTYIINSENNAQLTLKLDKAYTNKLLFITFDMGYAETCLIGDTSITINGITNTLSCRGWTYPNNNNEFTYVLSSNDPIDTLNIEFSTGKYEISNIKVYSLDYQYILDFADSIDEFQIDTEKTSGDNIYGTINVTENGYFVLSIPYDEGFTIYVDGNKVDYELVDNSFIGFPINEGSHEIQISYVSPYLLEGLITSLVGYMIFIPIIYSDFKKRRKRK